MESRGPLIRVIPAYASRRKSKWRYNSASYSVRIAARRGPVGRHRRRNL